MFSSESLDGAIEVLKLGVIGLGFILALLAFILLTREQKKTEPHTNIVIAIYAFMGFAVVLCGLGLYAQIDSSTDANALLTLQGEKVKLEGEISESLEQLKTRDDKIDILENRVQALSKELTQIKTSGVNWDYASNGHLFTCKVNGKIVGVALDCRNHDSCGNRQLNRAICALRFSDQIWK